MLLLLHVQFWNGLYILLIREVTTLLLLCIFIQISFYLVILALYLYSQAQLIGMIGKLLNVCRVSGCLPAMLVQTMTPLLVSSGGLGANENIQCNQHYVSFVPRSNSVNVWSNFVYVSLRLWQCAMYVNKSVAADDRRTVLKWGVNTVPRTGRTESPTTLNYA